MEVCRKSSWLLPLLGVILLAVALQGVQGEVETEGPSESECRPYIEKALRSLEHGAGDADVGQSNEEAFSIDNIGIDEKQSNEQRSTEDSENKTESAESPETQSETVHAENDSAENQLKNDESIESTENDNEQPIIEETHEAHETDNIEEEIQGNEQLQPEDNSEEHLADEGTTETVSVETIEETMSSEEPQTQDITEPTQEASLESSTETTEDILESSTLELDIESTQEPSEPEVEGDVLLSQEEAPTLEAGTENTSKESETTEKESEENTKTESDGTKSDKDDEGSAASHEKEVISETSDENDSPRTESSEAESKQEGSSEDQDQNGSMQKEDDDSRQKRSVENTEDNSIEENSVPEAAEVIDVVGESIENVEEAEKNNTDESAEEKQGSEKSSESSEVENEQELSKTDKDDSKEGESVENVSETKNEEEDVAEDTNIEGQQEDSVDAPEEDLMNEIEIPKNLRPRDHVEQLLKIDRDATKTEEIIDRISEITLRELKRLYENAIKPLETLYKYRDLSNRHYGDAEIFSKPLILFMGPWSGGKSSIINYLLNVEYNDTALRTGAEPSPAYFNLLMYGEEEEILDGTELAADYTFSGLQKFGQGLEERLRGVKLKSKLLEKVNIVEIPGILEVRKQVSRVFPFNDACQWFIDRADIIFLVYDPSKLDVGPETEAILDQLKGREYQTRIVLNKADQVKPEELMRVQGALIWNISPLMSSPQPPEMYTTSLWSKPYEQWAPVRLLHAQERAFLRDLRSAVDRRIENKIASARRFAVRVRNHAKMVDCYLTTYYNHKSIFGNRKQVSDAIIENPQDYHIYEGLSTLTNISRYDLPDPDVYKDFFRLNSLYEFQQLSATCTYFRGCPINKLDVAIAYDLPELVGKHKRLVEAALTENNQDQDQGS